MFRLLALSLVLLMTFMQAFAVNPPEPSPKQDWYNGFIFQDPSFTYELIRTLGYAYEQGADLGETLDTVRIIKDGDFNSWHTAWFNTANRLKGVADEFSKQKHVISAREVYLRTSNYFRTAGFYMVAPADRSKSIQCYRASKASFLKGIQSLTYIHSVKIPYQNTTLPGYWLQSDKDHAPVIIVNTGFDGTAEELYFEMGKALHRRGYHVLLIEGPGQGSVLREQNLPFRPDWEAVITPVVNFVEKQPRVDKNRIALVGISMGGYLAPRAAAFEPRIKALVANGGIYDFGAVVYRTLPPALIQQIDANPTAFNQAIKEVMANNTTVRWFFENGMWSFAAATPAEFMQKVKAYNLKGIARQIKMDSLIIDSQSDSFMQGQPQALYQAIQGPKTLMIFTKEETAQSHCQMGAIAISNEKIINWLDEHLK